MKRLCWFLLAVVSISTVRSAPVAPLVASKDYDYVKNRPIVKVIKDGYMAKNKDGTFAYTSSITYIEDGPDCQIIVDTGVPSDTRNLLRSLAMNEILPTEITLVISTHSHPDHIGNLNLFSYATYLVGNRTLENQLLTYLPAGEKMGSQSTGGGRQYQMRFVCPNVAVLHVQAHTDDDLVVLVNNAKDFGNVSVTGDVFLQSSDIDDESIWLPTSQFPESQRQLRRMLIADSDYIIPGHGPGFKVSKDMRTRLTADETERDPTCRCSSTNTGRDNMYIKDALQSSLGKILDDLNRGFKEMDNTTRSKLNIPANFTSMFDDFTKKIQSPDWSWANLTMNGEDNDEI